MEQFKALRAGGKPSSFQHTTIDAAQLEHLCHEAGAPCVFLVEAGDLQRLAAQAAGNVLTLRGEKDPRRQLAYYFRKRSGAVGVRGIYKHAGLVERGVRDLLRSEDLLPGLVCVIGLRQELFDAVSHRSARTTGSPSPVGALPGYSDDTLRELLDNHAAFPVPPAQRDKFAGIAKEYIGSSIRIERVRRLIWLAAQSKHPVLIQGESGTGKEIVARQIRECSPHAYESFIPLNCGAIPAELFESELFGAVPGAYTGAVNRSGLVSAAKNGVLFLDEIGELLPHHQAKLLRLLENKEFTQVGSPKILTSNARIIAATNRDLATLVRQGKFREDLYYRLFTIRIRTPALREHAEDIPELAQTFWQKLNRDDGQSVENLPAAITDLLAKHAWPGNARELRATLVNIAMLAAGRPATVSLVRAVMRDRFGLGAAATVPRPGVSSDADG